MERSRGQTGPASLSFDKGAGLARNHGGGRKRPGTANHGTVAERTTGLHNWAQGMHVSSLA